MKTRNELRKKIMKDPVKDEKYWAEHIYTYIEKAAKEGKHTIDYCANEVLESDANNCIWGVLDILQKAGYEAYEVFDSPRNEKRIIRINW